MNEGKKRSTKLDVPDPKRRRVEHKEGLLGTIESVHLQNFMCHDNLKFEFGPHLNFVIGQNGSGKSAILTGIILALGGTSSVTGRYTNIKGFIKNGKQRAHVSVNLRNGGEFAYKPDVYGNKITVERDISKDGTSQYKLKSSAGHVVSTGKEELNNILTAMDIQISNPVTLLTQEVSRTFLTSKSAEKMYQFFFKGCGLQNLQDGYTETQQQRDETYATLKKKQQILEEKKKELKKWKSYTESAAKIIDYRNELSWATTFQAEELVGAKEKELLKNEKHLGITKSQIDKCAKGHKKYVDELEKLKKDKDLCKQGMEEHKKILEEIRSENEKISTAMRKLEGTYKFCRREEEKLQEEITNLENSINDSKQKDQNELSTEKLKREEEIKDLKKKNGEEDMKLRISHEKMKLLEEQKEHHQEKINNNAEETKNLFEEIKHLNAELQNLKSEMTNRISAFGDKTKEILDEINRERNRFDVLPIGPIGMYVKVKDAKWAPAVESCVGISTLMSYCCDNEKDSSVLRGIFQKICRARVPSIIISKFLKKVHNVGRLNCPYDRVLDMLEICNPVVTNCLIDQHSIECKILVDDYDTVVNLMMDNPPQNCTTAYRINCDQILCNPFRLYSAETVRRSILVTVGQDFITEKNTELLFKSEKFQMCNNQKKDLEAEMKKYDHQFRQLSNEIVKIKVDMRYRTDQIKELMVIEEPKDVSCLQTELETMETEKTEKANNVRNCEAELSDIRQQKRALNEKWDRERGLLQEKKEQFDNLGVKINKCGEEKETLSTGKIKFEAEMKSLEAKCKGFEEELVSLKEDYQKCLHEAQELGDRVETDRTPEEIQHLLREAEKVVTQQSKCGEHEIRLQFETKLNAFKTFREEMKRIETHINKVNEMLKDRQSKFVEMLGFMETIIGLNFTTTLNGNGYEGKMIFNANAGTLKLSVSAKRRDTSKQSTTSLSGGEKSFTTISFILALWQKINMPFRILDEYDVFMDSKNRRISIDLLKKHAEDYKGVQFILFSPLDLPHLKDGPNLQIHRMPDPKRVGLSSMD